MKRALGTALCLVLLGAPASGTETFRGDNGRLAFTRLVGDRGCSRVVTVKPDGSDRTRITPDGGCTWSYPAFSPNGRRILAVREPPNRPGIFVMRRNGSDRTRIARVNGYLTRPPVWSPDGTKIAFERIFEDRSHTRIYVVPSGGGEVVEIARRWVTDAHSEDLFWSPSSEKILYVADRSGPRGADLHLVHADGSGSRKLTDDRRYETTPDWSPDGRVVVFASRGDLFRLRLGGGRARRITDTARTESNPVFSPDGRRLAFEWSKGSHRSRIAVMTPRGNGRRRLSPKRANALRPVWSPDGRSIAFQDVEHMTVEPAGSSSRRERDGIRNGVYVVDVASRDLHRIFRGYLLWDDLDWGPAP